MAVFDRYVELRRQGTSQDVTKQRLQPVVVQLTREEIAQLVQMTKAWEAKLHAALDPGAPDPALNELPTQDDTQTRRAIKRLIPLAPTSEALPAPPPPQPSGKTSMVIPPSLSEERVACPNCGKLNRSNEAICYSCGQLLKPVTLNETRMLDSSQVSVGKGSDYFARSSSMVLYLASAKKSMETSVEEEVTLGRTSQESVLQPEVDLTAFDSEQLGVSRLHAKIVRSGDTLTLVDMKSRNHTYLNGQRVHPNEVRVLHDGDEIRLGRLAFRVIFRHNS